MANAYKLYVNRPVSYLDNTRPAGDVRAIWTAARIVSIVSQTSVVLEKKNSDGTRSSINGGVAVAKYTRASGETNVWRPY